MKHFIMERLCKTIFYEATKLSIKTRIMAISITTLSINIPNIMSLSITTLTWKMRHSASWQWLLSMAMLSNIMLYVILIRVVIQSVVSAECCVFIDMPRSTLSSVIMLNVKALFQFKKRYWTERLKKTLKTWLKLYFSR